MKTKYRIVLKPCNDVPGYYVAQYKWLNLFWIDCDPVVSVPGYNISRELIMVELFVEALIADMQYDFSTKVVKEY